MKNSSRRLAEACEELGATRRELAALLDLSLPEYLQVEQSASLPAEVEQRLLSLKRAKAAAVERAAVHSPSSQGRLVVREYNAWVSGSAALWCIATLTWGGRLLVQGSFLLGLAFIVAGVSVAPFLLGDERCATCGARLFWSLARASCPKCGAELKEY